jgi:hypothetical protein
MFKIGYNRAGTKFPQWNGSFGHVRARTHMHLHLHTQTHTYIGTVTSF